MNEIEVTGLRKEYGSFLAVECLDFEIGKGEIFGIVGPNGAGKTTTLKMLSGLIIPTSGSIKIKGLDMKKESRKIKQKLGFLPEESPLYEGMTANEYLFFFAEVYSIDKETASNRIRDILNALRLDTRDKKIGEMSKGMQRKVAIARALINDPEYLVLDEMTSGLDPTTSRYLSNFVSELKKQGKTIIFSAHNLYQVESICDRILIMNHGKVVSIGTLPEIKKKCGAIEYSIEFNVNGSNGTFDFAAVRNNGNFMAHTKDLEEFNNITGWVAKNNGKIINIKTIETSLEDIFLKLMN